MSEVMHCVFTKKGSWVAGNVLKEVLHFCSGIVGPATHGVVLEVFSENVTSDEEEELEGWGDATVKPGGINCCCPQSLHLLHGLLE